jgi:hypothetical protein
MEIVEQPFGGWRHRLLPRVLGECRVDLAQGAHVLRELPQVSATAAALPSINREQRRQTSGVLLQQLNAEQLLAISQSARPGERTTQLYTP